MSETSFASSETRVYRLSLLYRVYHFAAGTAALVAAILTYHFLILSVGLFLFAMFMIARPLILKVTVDQSSVTVKGMFDESSLQRSAITAFERIHTARDNYIMLRGTDGGDFLMIPEMYKFDEAWDDWLRTLKDFSDDKPLTLF